MPRVVPSKGSLRTGQAPERPRHIRGLLPLLRSRPGGVRSRAIARRPEPDKIADCRFAIADLELAILNRKSQIGNRQSHWRRGWDSNPRYSFPYTAFPVLPVKPLLHLSRFSIADCQLSISEIKALNAIANRQSTIRMAERVGFEPTVPLRVQRFSRPPDSTTLAPLRMLSA